MLLPEALRQVPCSAKAGGDTGPNSVFCNRGRLRLSIPAQMTWLHVQIIAGAFAFGPWAHVRCKCRSVLKDRKESEWHKTPGTGVRMTFDLLRFNMRPSVGTWLMKGPKKPASDNSSTSKPSPSLDSPFRFGSGDLRYHTFHYHPAMWFLNHTDWWQGILRGACAVFDS